MEMNLKNMERPVVLLSKCIEHEACRYDGSMVGDSFVKRLENYVDFILVCPEVEIGLPIPREAIRIIDDNGVEKLVFSRSGNDLTKKMQTFVEYTVDNLKKKSIHGAILKSRSPSCGIKDVKVYKYIGKSPSAGYKTAGFFGREVISVFDGLAIEDEGRLTNYDIRNHFLTRIFTMYSYESVKKENSINALIKFHSNNKYLLMAYHQTNQKALGKLVANHNNEPIEKIIINYEQILKHALATPMKTSKNINMLMHLFGYFKNKLSKDEKSYFLDLLEQYSSKKVPFSVPLTLIGGWVVRFNEPYLKDQTIFSPYPRAILDVADSGKGID